MDNAVKPLTDNVVKQVHEKSAKSKQQCIRSKRAVFLKGPIPIYWLSRAAKMGGKCLAVGIVIWLLSGFKRNKKVKLEHKWLRTLGVGRNAVYNNLKKLENANLIQVDHSPGCSPIITIIGHEDAVGR